MPFLPGVVGGAGFVCGSLRCLESLRASEQEEEGDCPESYPTLKRRNLTLPKYTENVCSKCY